MVNIFANKQVWQANIWIPLRKFGKGLLYTVGVTAISYVIDAFSTGNVPQEWVIYSGIIIAAMTAIKKGLETYEPAKDR